MAIYTNRKTPNPKVWISHYITDNDVLAAFDRPMSMADGREANPRLCCQSSGGERFYTLCTEEPEDLVKHAYRIVADDLPCLAAKTMAVRRKHIMTLILADMENFKDEEK